ncbi:efflux RND transporter periplasmic adaptor subunit [Thalassospira mesophila]|uniref:efflux RND transporter periplasmic adaptor subunit n=1 Tax=Thalassospira mesophila TaxID=1293891 RepID=UPI001FE80187|nr:efflux RND transporter periplasmic adaptor subunit [Thalassospira mesophila]
MSVRSCLKAAGMVAMVIYVAGCDEQKGGGNAAAQQAPATQVTFVEVQPQTVGLVAELPGRTVASRKADVRPQVDGIITERNFTEGATVKAGQQLYQIDQSVYLANLDAAQAELARSRATLDQATKTRARYDKLIKTQAVSEQARDDAIAAEAQGKASVASARAEIDKARINLQYTTVTAPIPGKIGASSVTEGALVTANQEMTLATITQLDPIYVDVTQAGGRLMQINQGIASGRIKNAADGDGVDVRLMLDSTGDEYGHIGKIQFADVTVNETTGTVRLRAVFDNPDQVLLPGMFVRAFVDQGQVENAYLVPQRAVMRRPDGSAYVFTIKSDNTVEAKALTIEQSKGSDWIVIKGLNPGDHIIVDGLQRVGPGAPVTPVAAKSDDAQPASR